MQRKASERKSEDMPKEKSRSGKNMVSEERRESIALEDKPVLEEIRISVRNLVEFVLRHGDIDNRHKASPDRKSVV